MVAENPAVTFFTGHPDGSAVHPSRRVWMHHLELHSPAEVDDEVRAWLQDAYDAAR